MTLVGRLEVFCSAANVLQCCMQCMLPLCCHCASVLPLKLFPFPLQVWLDLAGLPLLPKVTSWVASLDPPFHLLRLLFGLLCDIGAKYFILSFYFVQGPNVIEVDS